MDNCNPESQDSLDTLDVHVDEVVEVDLYPFQDVWLDGELGLLSGGVQPLDGTYSYMVDTQGNCSYAAYFGCIGASGVGFVVYQVYHDLYVYQPEAYDLEPVVDNSLVQVELNWVYLVWHLWVNFQDHWSVVGVLPG